MLFPSLINLLLTFVLLINGQTTQRYSVKIEGELRCGIYPAPSIIIRLYQDKSKSHPRLLSDAHTNMDGNFTIEGTTNNPNDHPLLIILHDCGDGMKKGQRKMRFKIPQKYWTKEEEETKIFSFGAFNLETKIKHNEERVDEVNKFKFRRYAEIDVKNLKVTEKPNLDKYEEPDDRNDPW